MTLPLQVRKLLVMEIAGLGDNVHLLPALWLVRQAYPRAQLHVMAAAGSAGLFRMTPWVDRVWAYPWSPRPRMLEHLRWGLQLRAERFDFLINFSGSDRSTTLAGISGARERWGRRPHDGGMGGFGWFYTRVLQQPFDEPMYLQKWKLLRNAGFAAGAQPEFHAAIGPEPRRAAGIVADDDGAYLHVSPFAAYARKELPAAQMAELLAGLQRQFPDHRLVLSCAPASRERDALERLLTKLPVAPWKVFAGTLDIPQLAAVIQGAALHLCPDTGSFHLARLAHTPVVCWYRKHGGEHEWVEPSPACRVLYSDQGSAESMAGVETAQIVEAARELLQLPRRMS